MLSYMRDELLKIAKEDGLKLAVSQEWVAKNSLEAVAKLKAKAEKGDEKAKARLSKFKKRGVRLSIKGEQVSGKNPELATKLRMAGNKVIKLTKNVESGDKYLSEEQRKARKRAYRTAKHSNPDMGFKDFAKSYGTGPTPSSSSRSGPRPSSSSQPGPRPGPRSQPGSGPFGGSSERASSTAGGSAGSSAGSGSDDIYSAWKAWKAKNPNGTTREFVNERVYGARTAPPRPQSPPPPPPPRPKWTGFSPDDTVASGYAKWRESGRGSGFVDDWMNHRYPPSSSPNPFRPSASYGAPSGYSPPRVRVDVSNIPYPSSRGSYTTGGGPNALAIGTAAGLGVAGLGLAGYGAYQMYKDRIRRGEKPA